MALPAGAEYNRAEAAARPFSRKQEKVAQVPLYEYQCQPQNHRFEVRHGINEEPVQSCPECGGPVRRVIHPVGIVFKGSGFYATDSRKSTSESKPTSGESKPTETKSETKSESTTESKAS